MNNGKKPRKCTMYITRQVYCIFCRYFQLSYVRYFSILSPICWCCCSSRCFFVFCRTLLFAIIVVVSLSARSDNQFNCNSSSFLYTHLYEHTWRMDGVSSSSSSALRCDSHGVIVTVDSWLLPVASCQLLSIVRWLLTVLFSNVVFVYAVYESLCQLCVCVYVCMCVCVYIYVHLLWPSVRQSINCLECVPILCHCAWVVCGGECNCWHTYK